MAPRSQRVEFAPLADKPHADKPHADESHAGKPRVAKPGRRRRSASAAVQKRVQIASMAVAAVSAVIITMVLLLKVC